MPLLFVIDDTFAIKDRGVVAVGNLANPGCARYRIGDPVEIRRHDGSIVQAVISGTPMGMLAVGKAEVLLRRLSVSDIGAGDQVWIGEAPDADSGGAIDHEQADPFDLARFTTAQEGVYNRALAEIRAGDKRSHWMWFIFPQIDGLGFSPTAKQYAIKSPKEASAYLAHPVLGPTLLECSEAVLAVERRSAYQIFGTPDDLKLKSCMTLFEAVAERDSIFGRVLDKFYQRQRDGITLEILAAMNEGKGRTKPC